MTSRSSSRRRFSLTRTAFALLIAFIISSYTRWGGGDQSTRACIPEVHIVEVDLDLLQSVRHDLEAAMTVGAHETRTLWDLKATLGRYAAVRALEAKRFC